MPLFQADGVGFGGGGGGGGESLAATLAIGNITGGNDIILTQGFGVIGLVDAGAGATGGDAILQGGLSTLGATGDVLINTPSPATAGEDTGDVMISTNLVTLTGASGNIDLLSGSATGAGGAAGRIRLDGGSGTVGTASGAPIQILSGSSVDGASGDITLTAGQASGTGTDGDVIIIKHATITAGAGANGDAVLVIEADTDNLVETSTPYMLYQWNGGDVVVAGMSGVSDEDPAGNTFTGSGTNDFIINARDGDAISMGADGTAQVRLRESGAVSILGLNYPAADGSANDVLITNGAGALSFTDVNGLITAGTGGIYEGSGTAPSGVVVSLTDELIIEDLRIKSTGSNDAILQNMVAGPTQVNVGLRMNNGGKMTFGTDASNIDFMTGTNASVLQMQIKTASNVVEVMNNFSATGLLYPTSDGSANDIMITNGASVLSFSTPADLASLAFSGKTGVITGGKVIVNGGDGTLFNVAACEGQVVDYSTPASAVHTPVSFAGATGVSLDTPAAEITYVYLDSAGTLTQQNTPITNSQRKTVIALAVILHINGTDISHIFNSPTPVYDTSLNILDYISAIGLLNNNNEVTANGTNLSLDKAIGTVTYPHLNFHTSASNPTQVTVAADALLDMVLVFRDGSGGWTYADSTATVIDPGFSDDDSGTLAAVGANDYTIQRLYLIPDSDGNHAYLMYYGQVVYNKLGDALEGLDTPVEVDPIAANFGLLIAQVAVKGDATALNDITQARVVSPGSSSSSGGTAIIIPTLSQVLDEGNTTGGSDLIISSTDAITAPTGEVVSVTADVALPANRIIAKEAAIGDIFDILGLTALTTDSTPTSTIDGGNLTDVTTEATSLTGSTFTFQGTAQNHSILIGSATKFFGIVTEATIATVIGASTRNFVAEVWDGAAWAEVKTMSAGALGMPARYGNELFLRVFREHLFLGIDSTTTWVSKTISGSDLFWVRLRISTTDVTTAPTFEAMGLSRDTFFVNETGVEFSLGGARNRRTLLAAGDIFGEAGGVTNASPTVGTGAGTWTHEMKNNLLNASADAIMLQFILPRGIDTSLPLFVEVAYQIDAGEGGDDIDLTVEGLPIERQGVLVADPAGGLTPLPRTAANTGTTISIAGQVTAHTNQLNTDLNKIYSLDQTTVDIADVYAGDIMALRIELTDDGVNNSDVLIWGVEISGAFWTNGDLI